jgi:DNA-directed RNA polymerase subunit RPC12/RpoP
MNDKCPDCGSKLIIDFDQEDGVREWQICTHCDYKELYQRWLEEADLDD